MNLGTQTNNLVNNMYSRMVNGSPVPKVGMGATTLSWTDRHAATVTKVTEFASKKWAFEISVVHDNVTVISGSVHDGSAEFATTPNPAGYADLYRMDKAGKWVHGFINRETGKFKKSSGGLILGIRDHHIDPSF